MDEGARFWDRLLAAPALPWGRGASPVVELLAARLPAGAAVLVPGCAYGRNAWALARRGFAVTAYDYAPAAIARARAEFAHPRVRYLVADARDVPPGAYQGVFCHFLLHLFFRAAERRALVAALAAALAPGGLLLASGLSTRAPFFGRGTELEPDTWSNPGWVPIHFYTAASLAAELAPLTILSAVEGDEPEDKPDGRVLTPAVYALAQRPAGAPA
ncbi:MAG TPA: methyltransferase domain-containing protein [Chloroflexota bacterium]|nr:methyltransferase domain-containing protein [Chloroflexota bacterium]